MKTDIFEQIKQDVSRQNGKKLRIFRRIPVEKKLFVFNLEEKINMLEVIHFFCILQIIFALNLFKLNISETWQSKRFM